jgi:hypothetical protein
MRPWDGCTRAIDYDEAGFHVVLEENLTRVRNSFKLEKSVVDTHSQRTSVRVFCWILANFFDQAQNSFTCLGIRNRLDVLLRRRRYLQ